MADDYIIPLGIDAQGVTKGIDDTLAALDSVEKKAGQTGKSIEDMFGQGAKGADNFENAMKPTGRSMEELGKASRKARQELGEAFDVRREAAEFGKQVESVRKQLDGVTGRKRIGLEVDKKTVKDLQDALKYVKDNYSEMQKTFAGASEELRTNISATQKEIDIITADLKDLESAFEKTAPGSVWAEMKSEIEAANVALQEETAALQDYEAQLAQVDGANKNMQKTLTDATKAVQSFEEVQEPLRRQLLEVRREMQQLEYAGMANTEQFRELSKEAAGLQTQVDLTQKRIKTMADENGLLRATIQGAQGLVGLFSTFNGVLALTGVESDEAQQMLLKVNGAMAVLQGTQAVMNALQKDSAFNILILNRLRKQEVVEITAQTSATTASTAATRASTIATRALGVALKAIGIGLIVSAVALLVENWDKLVAGFKSFLPAGDAVGKTFDRIRSVAVGVGNAVFQYLVMPFRALYSLLTGNLEEFKNTIMEGMNFKKNYTDAFNKSELDNERRHQRELEKTRIEAEFRELERRKNRGEDVASEEMALQARLVAIQKAGSKEYDEEMRRLEDMQDGHYKRAIDAQAKASEEARKQSEEARKKRLEDAQKANEQLLRYATALEDARIAAIQDAGERERAAINTEYARRIDDLRGQQALTAEAVRQQAELEQALIEERDRKLLELQRQAAADQIELRLEARQIMADLQQESLTNDLELLEIDHQQRMSAIEEQYKDEEDLRVMLIAALEQSTQRERNKIQQEWSANNLKEEEERQLLMLDLMGEYAVKNENTERQKQIAILQIKQEFAQRTLDSLLASGEAETSVAVLQARNTIRQIQQELKEEIDANQGQGFDFLTFVGLGELDTKQRTAVTEAGRQMAESLKGITDFVVSQYDRQIEKKQEVIDFLDDEINDIEKRLDKERSLREAGFANDVALLEEELAAKKQAQEEEIRQQEEIQKKREQMQRAQMAADTAMQLVNMITASTNIFKSLSGIPFIGIPLAIATIGLMFGAFVGAKIKAAQAIQQGQSYGEGGWIDGKPHSQGGKKYYSDTGEVRELERDEFVVRKKQARKYGKLLEAINEDKLSAFDLNDDSLNQMLKELGITFMDSSIKKGLDESKELSQLRTIVVATPSGGDRELKEMNENIKFLAKSERERTHSWEDEKYIYTKKGSRTTRILKNPENGNDTE